ncbi:MAG: hypothetical protein ACREJC_14215 [Tepidisphaeraceae bacterium]
MDSQRRDSLRDQNLWNKLARIAAQKQREVQGHEKKEDDARQDDLRASAFREALDQEPERWDGLS